MIRAAYLLFHLFLVPCDFATPKNAPILHTPSKRRVPMEAHLGNAQSH